MASDGPKVPLDSPEDQREGNHSFSCLTDTAAPETEFPAGHNNDKATDTTTGSTEQGEEGGDVCQFFLMGKCHFGHRCRLSHSHSLDGREDDDEKVEKHKKKKGKVNKTTKPKDTEETETAKKPRMRTADEVISRVLWDPSVKASEFMVGYVDRFLGVLERPFSDFNWDADPCDCDYTTELALPRHRILYFTHRGVRVWDRHSRTDRVFGSTGHTLAPPFAGVEEVEEVRTQDAEQPGPLNPDPLESAEDQRSPIDRQAEGELEELTSSEHLGEDGQNDTDIHTTVESTTQPAPYDTGSTPQRCQEAGRESTPDLENILNGPQTSTEQLSQVQRDGETGEEEGPEECWRESWDGVRAKDELCHIGPGPPVPLEQREEEPGSRLPKRRPTHFITFRANTPSILSSYQRLQEELTSLLPSSAPHWKAPSTLHVTLCLLVLRGPAEVAAAGEILQRFAYLDRNPPVAASFPVKLKHFNGKVLYLSPQPQLPIQHLNGGLQEAYRKEGWLHRNSFNPRYHLTLAKVEDREGPRVFEGVGDLKVGKGLNFGRLPVNTLHLCAMGVSKIDGFYEILRTVTLR